jgi:hypothetical protein
MVPRRCSRRRMSHPSHHADIANIFATTKMRLTAKLKARLGHFEVVRRPIAGLSQRRLGVRRDVPARLWIGASPTMAQIDAITRSCRCRACSTPPPASALLAGLAVRLCARRVRESCGAREAHQRPFVGQCGGGEPPESVSTAPAIDAGRLNTPAAAEGRARGPLRAVILPLQ